MLASERREYHTGWGLIVTSPGPGFTTSVDKLEEIANIWLPQVAQELRVPIGVLTEHTSAPRPVEVEEVSGMERAYVAFTEAIAERQRTGCHLIDATAAALRDIAALYRRVDGQG